VVVKVFSSPVGGGGGDDDDDDDDDDDPRWWRGAFKTGNINWSGTAKHDSKS
jgi:hypothetical protein